jgi:SAM-dependent methyltransferase
MRLRNLFRPLYLAGRIKNWLYENQHPDHPWLAPGAIEWLETHLQPEMRGWEWGSGRSTLWFAKRIASLTSIESDPAWFARVRTLLSGVSNVEFRLIPIEHELMDTYRHEYEPTPAMVAEIRAETDESLDFIVIDSWYRPVCCREALPKLKPGGILLIDNTDWSSPPHALVPAEWPLVHRSRNVLTQTSIWRKPPFLT